MHARSFVALGLLMVSCAQPATPVAPVPDASPQSAVDASSLQPAPDAGPVTLDAAPEADARAGTTTLDDLPAVSEDGQRVAIAARVADGARGRDNLSLVILEVDGDHVAKRVVIVDPNDAERPGRGEREDAANRVLAADRWVRLVKYELAENPAAPERQGGLGMPFRANVAKGEGLVVDYREPLLVVRDGKREVVNRAMPSFSKRGGAHCKGCVVCPPPLSNAAAVYGNRSRGVLVIEVEYRGGTDLCWEPDQTLHVVRITGP